ncbi:MAG: hypothetical protein QOF94_2559, partial [Acidobacteriaceae bacterium]
PFSVSEGGLRAAFFFGGAEKGLNTADPSALLRAGTGEHEENLA